MAALGVGSRTLGETVNPELHLFVLWEKARRIEARVLDDLARQNDIKVLGKWELAFSGAPEKAYPAFYGGKKPLDGRLKVRKCGGGAFLLIVVRNLNPSYGLRWARDDKYYLSNELMYDLKARYREWAGRKHRVHGTTGRAEFARDIFLLTGHTADEWERGVPDDIRLNIPSCAEWRQIVDDVGADMGLSDCRVILENKYINDVFFKGSFKDRGAIVKCSSTCAWSIGNEFRLASRLRAVAPSVVPEPLAAWTSDDGRRAFVVTEEVDGPSLTDLLLRGVTDAQADGFAADILALAEALNETGILHRDIYTDNFLLGGDGHLKVIDFQMAIDRNCYREDPWVAAHPKFLYVVFGVNHDTPCGCWDDRAALDAVLALLPATDAVTWARRRLAAMPDISFAARPPLGARLVLGAYAVSLMIQSHVPWRSRKRRNQARKRLATIRAYGGTDVDGRDPETMCTGKASP